MGIFVVADLGSWEILLIFLKLSQLLLLAILRKATTVWSASVVAGVFFAAELSLISDVHLLLMAWKSPRWAVLDFFLCSCLIIWGFIWFWVRGLGKQKMKLPNSGREISRERSPLTLASPCKSSWMFPKRFRIVPRLVDSEEINLNCTERRQFGSLTHWTPDTESFSPCFRFLPTLEWYNPHFLQQQLCFVGASA